MVGQSTQGRDLYLITLTAPETRAQTAQQTAWRDQLRLRPNAAARNAALKAGYKTPIWFSANIHGNEWEGTDAAMQYIRRIVDAPAVFARHTSAARGRGCSCNVHRRVSYRINTHTQSVCIP